MVRITRKSVESMFPTHWMHISVPTDIPSTPLAHQHDTALTAAI